ncbi:branched-chain amino acid ABC transporter permease [Ralstonia sp.]|uniref:branched-chain amino acid ABC transporter permease n=1 Tax=Ralstonia sp. TaxID=54061 RepID=UPI0031DCE0D4
MDETRKLIAMQPVTRGQLPRMSVARMVFCAMLLTGLVYLPWASDFATQRLLVEAFTVFAIALSWNLLTGYGGLVVIGHHAFVGVGAYALFALSNTFGINPWLTLPAAAGVTALFAALASVPMFRLSGPYFGVGTWVVAEMLRIVTLNAEPLGAGGGMPLDTLTDFDRWHRTAGVYWAALAVAVGSLVVARAILRGRLGLALRAVRDSEPAASASGVPVKRSKLALWCTAATMTGVAGAVAYMNTLQVTPDAAFSLNWTATAIFIAVLGGIGTLEGPILGTAVYFLLRESFSDYGTWYFIGLGVLAIATMVVSPGGLWALVMKRFSFDPFGIRRSMPSACAASDKRSSGS